MESWRNNREFFDIKQKELLEILEGMDIPEKRRELSDTNLGWLERNAFIRNGKHPNFSKLSEFLTCMRESAG